MLRLSQAFDVSVAELLGERLTEHAVRVTRAESRLPGTLATATSHGFEVLTRDGAALEAFVVHAAAEFPTDDPVPVHAGEELIFVLIGTIELRFADRGFVLEAGDCAQFPGSLPHRVRRIGVGPASALVAVTKTRNSRGRRPPLS